MIWKRLYYVHPFKLKKKYCFVHKYSIFQNCSKVQSSVECSSIGAVSMFGRIMNVQL